MDQDLMYSFVLHPVIDERAIMTIQHMSYILACGFVTAHATAELIEVDNEFGQGAGTVDSENLLEYLDLTETVGISFNDMVGVYLADGGLYAGWRMAETYEIRNLIRSSGIVDVQDFPSTYDSGLMWPIMSLVGVTAESQPGYHESRGFVVSSFNQDGFARVVTLREIDNIDFSFAFDSGELEDQASGTIGFWLVRETTIPTPSGLLVFGGAWLFAGRRRR
jgi:hypothetical protein